MEIGFFKLGMLVIFVFCNIIMEVKSGEIYYKVLVEVLFGDNVVFNVKYVFVKDIR